LEIKDLVEVNDFTSSSTIPTPYLGYAIGVAAAFIAGIVACKWMIKLVKGTNLMWFAVYCFVVGAIALIM
jgi:undecaprenyl-diphosphatase